MTANKYNDLVLSVLQLKTPLTWYAAALYDFKDGSKVHKYHLSDKTPLTTAKPFNCIKAYLTPKDKILVFDFDDPATDYTAWEHKFPTLVDTLVTTSSQLYKRHYYVRYALDSLDNLRDTRSIDGLDILSGGVIQEAYPTSTVHSNADIQHLTLKEEELLLTLVKSKASKVIKGTFYSSYENLVVINRFIINGMPKRRADLRQLLQVILPAALFLEEYKSKKGSLSFPNMDYQLFNDIITKISYAVD